nr:MAG TPA: hypothetical protein [Caudoviricetes sp.]
MCGLHNLATHFSTFNGSILTCYYGNSERICDYQK